MLSRRTQRFTPFPFFLFPFCRTETSTPPYSMKSRLLPYAVLLGAALPLHAQNPPKGFEKVDQEIVISTLQAAMKYDVRSFSVKPNAKVKLTFKNPDDLPHNLIICTPGKSKGGDKGKEVIDAVLKLGEKGVEQNWEPRGHPRILHSTGMVQPKKDAVIWFRAPKKEGNYPYICTFPGHFELMNGMMGVSKRANPVTNLTYKFYHGNWTKLPDFSTLEAKKTGALASGLFDLGPRDRDDGFGFVFTGEIECPKDGIYTFETSSDDGSRLYIDDKAVVNNDGVHPNRAAKGQVRLKAGKRKIEVRYFEGGGEQNLYVGWSGPGVKKQSLSNGSSGGGGGGPSGMLITAEEGEAAIYRNFITDAGPPCHRGWLFRGRQFHFRCQQHAFRPDLAGRLHGRGPPLERPGTGLPAPRWRGGYQAARRNRIRHSGISHFSLAQGRNPHHGVALPGLPARQAAAPHLSV